MVGNGILLVCLNHPDIEEILVINRRPLNTSHPKLKEIIHQDFFDLSQIENQLSGYDACFYCIGVTSPFIKESKYYEITHDLTIFFASRLIRINPSMTFCYISGLGADSQGKARFMQTRVKGQTEAGLSELPFKRVFSFRPGILKPVHGQKHVYKMYFMIMPFYPVFRLLFPGFFLTLQELALAMIRSVETGYNALILEVKDIVSLAKK